MKKGIAALIVLCGIVFMLAFGCSNSNPSGPSAPTNTPTITPAATSTAVVSPNLSGSITVPAGANGKQFAVVVDSDTNTANGNVAQFIGIVNSTTMPYSFLVTAGNYYVYAYVDMNNSGMTGPGGTDYFGNYGAWSQVTPAATGVDFNCTTQLDITITVNVTVPASIPGEFAFFGLFNGNTYASLTSPAAGDDGITPAGTQFTWVFSLAPDKTGTYYFLGFVDANSNCGGSGCFPDEGDYLRVYGGSMTQWPASPNFTVAGDMTVDLSLDSVIGNVSGTATLPGSANGNNYTVFASTVPMSADMTGVFMITKTAAAGAGTAVDYSLFMPVPGSYYIALIVDMDGSGWDNGGTGPANQGDFVGIYGVTPPVLNWMNPFPQAPNASLPGTGFNFTCDTVPDVGNPPATPTTIPTPASGGGTGTISGSISIPSGQSGKNIMLYVDMDLIPDNGNTVNAFSFGPLSVTHTSINYSLSGIPAGANYYVYGAAVAPDSPPVAGDAVGVCGTAYPEFPASPNVSVTNGGTTTANLPLVVAAANVSGRVYMPASASLGSLYGVVIDSDMNGGNGGTIAMGIGAIGSGQTYFDYSMLLALPGDYYIYAVVDAADPRDLFTNGPGVGDYMGYHNYPLPVHLVPAVNNTNRNINCTVIEP